MYTHTHRRVLLRNNIKKISWYDYCGWLFWKSIRHAHRLEADGRVDILVLSPKQSGGRNPFCCACICTCTCRSPALLSLSLKLFYLLDEAHPYYG